MKASRLQITFMFCQPWQSEYDVVTGPRIVKVSACFANRLVEGAEGDFPSLDKPLLAHQLGGHIRSLGLADSLQHDLAKVLAAPDEQPHVRAQMRLEDRVLNGDKSRELLLLAAASHAH